MRIQINGKHIDVGEAMSTHIEDRVSDLAGKYAERPVESAITLSKDAHEFVCDASIHLSTGLTAQAKAHATDIYAAFDICADKMEKQLRRYKRRLKDHHKDRIDPIESIGAPSYILAPSKEEEAEDDSLTPMIIAEMETPVQTLSVGEAVMQMELAHKNMLVFRNVSHGGVNVVYIRDDGNIGWVDPRNSG